MSHFNTVQSLSGLVEYTDLVTLFDNRALRTVATQKRNGLGLPEAKFTDLNALVARVMTSVLSPLWMCPTVAESQMLDPRKLMTSLVPYPRIHFTVPCLSP